MSEPPGRLVDAAPMLGHVGASSPRTLTVWFLGIACVGAGVSSYPKPLGVTLAKGDVTSEDQVGVIEIDGHGSTASGPNARHTITWSCQATKRGSTWKATVITGQ